MPRSSARFATPLRLEPRGSFVLAVLMLLVHAGAAAALWLADLPAWIDAALGMWIAASYLQTCMRHVLHTLPDAVVQVSWTGSGPWRLVTRSGAVRHAELRGDTCVSPWLVLLNFRCRPGGRTSVVLLPDSLDRDELRRLRVVLRTTADRPP